jgi:hypothetical protein
MCFVSHAAFARRLFYLLLWVACYRSVIMCCYSNIPSSSKYSISVRATMDSSLSQGLYCQLVVLYNADLEIYTPSLSIQVIIYLFYPAISVLIS